MGKVESVSGVSFRQPPQRLYAATSITRFVPGTSRAKLIRRWILRLDLHIGVSAFRFEESLEQIAALGLEHATRSQLEVVIHTWQIVQVGARRVDYSQLSDYMALSKFLRTWLRG